MSWTAYAGLVADVALMYPPLTRVTAFRNGSTARDLCISAACEAQNTTDYRQRSNQCHELDSYFRCGRSQSPSISAAVGRFHTLEPPILTMIRM